MIRVGFVKLFFDNILVYSKLIKSIWIYWKYQYESPAGC